MAHRAAVVAALLALCCGAALAQQFSSCNDGKAEFDMIDAQLLPDSCTDKDTVGSLKSTFDCIKRFSVTLSGCTLSISSKNEFSSTKFPCYAVDFTGPLTGARLGPLPISDTSRASSDHTPRRGPARSCQQRGREGRLQRHQRAAQVLQCFRGEH
jgi:hypothetical protein